MAITLDPTVGGASANTYATLAEANTYMEGRLNKAEWDAADDTNKTAALVQAAILIDTITFKGYKSSDSQARKWPRLDVTDGQGWIIDSSIVPQAVKDAQCEMALSLLKEDRTDDGGVAPIRSVTLGSLGVVYDTGQLRKNIPDVVRALLSDLATSVSTVRLVRA